MTAARHGAGTTPSPGRAARLLAHRSIAGVAWVTVTVVAALSRALRRQDHHRVELCIESGRAGFDLIEVKEVVRSAQERYGHERVVTHVVEDRRRYLRAARARVRSDRPCRYWVDPRSGAQTWFRAVLQSIGLAHLLAWYGVIPLVWLTDVPVRRWRLQAEILSARRGMTLIVMDPRSCDIPFAHSRFVGPMPPPFSRRTLRNLEEARRSASSSGKLRIVFAGSLYEPRRSSLLRIQQELRERGLNLEIHARELGAPRIPDNEYWALLASADVVITTAVQVAGRGIDATSTPHLVYRYTEALLAGAALVAPPVPGSEHLYRPGTDFFAFESENDAIRIIQSLAEDPIRRRSVASAGHAQACGLVEEGHVWQAIERYARDDCRTSAKP